jgi:hypothetical protein
VCDTNQAVDSAYAAAINAGGTNEGRPADRTYFSSGYYAANVADFDGNRLKFVHKSWNPHVERRSPGHTTHQVVADVVDKAPDHDGVDARGRSGHQIRERCASRSGPDSA